MKKILFFIFVVGMISNVANASRWECNRYVNGKYEGWTEIHADNKVEAEQKCHEKYKKLGLKFDYIKVTVPFL